MPRATRVTVDDVACIANLAMASWKAAAGKRERREVRSFFGDLDGSIARLSANLRLGKAPENRYCRFVVFDPKRRTIDAPIFADRVVHHALVAHIGPAIERRLIDDSFACRKGKGTLAAVQRAQHFCRRYPWYGKLDVRAYFHTIHHGVLKRLIRRCIKGDALGICHRIIDGFEVSAGRGLPIGALTSQYFANLYLSPLDQLVTSHPGVRAVVRYMDDVVFWCDSSRAAHQVVKQLQPWVTDELRVKLHPGWVQRCARGLSFLGYRVYPSRLALSRRQQSRFRRARQESELAFESEELCGDALQRQMDAVLAVTNHADAAAWRRAEFCRRVPVDA